MATCEHCGSYVKLTPVCAKCGRDHSKEWMLNVYLDSKRVENSIGIFVILVALTVFIPNLDVIHYLAAFSAELAIAFLIGGHIMPVNPPREIKLDNGKILKI